MKLDIAIFGLSITSSWGNGHATTYRALVKALAKQGHRVTFLERDVRWYREHRDLHSWPYCRIELYDTLKAVPRLYRQLIVNADLVILGSFVTNGAALANWITAAARGVTAFYDIDTPVTLKRLEDGNAEYICAANIPCFDLYLSFTGGPTLDLIESTYGSPRARALYCAVDPQVHAPVAAVPRWELGYIGTYSEDRQAALEQLLIEPARQMPGRRFVVAGAQYPASISWPGNIDRIEHLPPSAHPEFYCSQRYTLNLTRSEMVSAGFSPSVRLFEAAACGVPIISDRWPGIGTFFVPGKEVLLAHSSEAVIELLKGVSEVERRNIAAAAHKRVLQSYTADLRAIQLEQYYREAAGNSLAEVEADAVAP
jgi:spore maturation protein CgeB